MKPHFGISGFQLLCSRRALPRRRWAPARTAFTLALAFAPAAALAQRAGHGSIRAAARPAAPEQRASESRAPEQRAPEQRAPEQRAPEQRAPEQRAPEQRGGEHVEASHRAPDVRPEVHAAPSRDVRVERNWDDRDEDVRNAGGFAHGATGRLLRGERVHDLPNHRVYHFHDRDYFYDDAGVYYEQDPGGEYIVVQPPLGVVVPALPPGVDTVQVGPTVYYYVDGIYYVAQTGGYAVVNPPPGIIVPELPTGASQVLVNGNVYYQFNRCNYQPIIQNGATAYVVTPM